MLIGLTWAQTAHAQVQPTNVEALHRSGQTFITWREVPDQPAGQYRVYRHDEPITADNVDRAQRLYEVPRDSGRLTTARYRLNDVWTDRYIGRLVIEDRAPPLAEGTGLLVWTLAPGDFEADITGDGYYAVTVSIDGAENRADFSAENTLGPLREGVADPVPVEVDFDVGIGGHLYLQYMDLRNWNPTFNAPRTQSYDGLDPADPAVRNALQYAYDYVVYEPYPDICGGEVPEGPFPMLMLLHGHGGNNYGPYTQLTEDYWCSYYIYPIDQRESWYFGFARDTDYRTSAVENPDDVIVNYGEQRLLRMIYDLQRDPFHGPRLDRRRLYVLGHSMGGSGALALAMRYPNVFAAAYASEPMTNFREAGTQGGTEWARELIPKWGSFEANLPIVIDGPGDWADHLEPYQGTGIWDWQNHQQNFVDRVGDEMALFGLAHGFRDNVVEWTTQARPIYPILDGARRPWGGFISADGHRWQGFRGMPPTFAENPSSTPFAGLQVVIDETVPGLSNFTGHELPLPPEPERTVPSETPPEEYPPTGGYNSVLDWSASWNAWDEAPVDETHRWQISLRTTDGTEGTVDITPRRLQTFCLIQGVEYTWETRRVADDTLVATATATPDPHGLLTLVGVPVDGQGTRILITRPAGGVEAGEPDLRMSIEPVSDRAIAGRDYTHSVIIENVSDHDAPSVVVVNRLTNATLVSTQPDAGHCVAEEGGATCRLGRIGAGERSSTRVTWRLEQAGRQDNELTVRSFGCDGESFADSHSAALEVGDFEEPDAEIPPVLPDPDAGVDAAPAAEDADLSLSDGPIEVDATPLPDADATPSPTQDADAEPPFISEKPDRALPNRQMPPPRQQPAPYCPVSCECKDEGCQTTPGAGPRLPWPAALMGLLLLLVIRRRSSCR